jgi:hypothetical protein
MDLMGSHLEAAFERLYRWVQASVKEELDLGGPGVDFISAALVALRQRPVLFRYCVEEMGKSRRAHILGTFLCALTQGGPNGVPRPIELSAHDPLRYVGDMASWLHQSMASEADLLRHILGDAANDAVNGGDDDDDDDSDDRPKNGEHNVDSAAATSGNAAVSMAEEPTEKQTEAAATDTPRQTMWQSVLDSAFQAVCRPFTLRVEQTSKSLSISSDGGHGWSTAYQLSHLLAFYARTLQDILPTAVICTAMSESSTQLMDAVLNAWREENDALLASPPLCPTDLSPSAAINGGQLPGASGVAQRLATAAELCGASLLSDHQSEAAFSPILKAGLEVPLRSCYLSAAAARLDESSVAIFMINNFACLESSLRPHGHLAASTLESLAVQIDTQCNALVSTQVSQILTSCGLVGPYRAVQGLGESGRRLADTDGCTAEELGPAFASFYSQLFSTAGPGAAGGAGSAEGASRILEACAKIRTPRLRAQSRTKIVVGLVDCYSALYDAVHQPANGYRDPAAIAVHTPAAVQMVLE